MDYNVPKIYFWKNKREQKSRGGNEAHQLLLKFIWASMEEKKEKKALMDVICSGTHGREREIRRPSVHCAEWVESSNDKVSSSAPR